jgi:predicted MFS family arabinose efflux permease
VSTEDQPGLSRHAVWDVLTHKHVLSGLMFASIAIFGLWVSRDYPIGTALRMGTGYVPRMLCWVLLALGIAILVQGLRQSRAVNQLGARASFAWRAPLFVTASLVIFGLAIENLGLVISILLLAGVGAVAAPSLRPLETAIAAIVLVVLSWAIFIVGLGLTIPVWPEW